jgi:UDP-N-acetylmuramoyl-L-alanyl-D-glutamate--2,6-diaminopimelate ligase
VDGLHYAPDAVKRGAVAVVAERSTDLAVPLIKTNDVARALGVAASRFFGTPTSRLQLVGITGTNGKTTTAYLVEAMLQAAEKQVGVLGTISYRLAGTVVPAPYTTPTAIVLQRYLAQMVEAGCSHGVLEVSSHGLQLGRLWGTDFRVAAFTNLTQDHLDLHGTLDDYLAAKRLLFTRHLDSLGSAVVNVDAEGARPILDDLRSRPDISVLRCSRQDPSAEIYLDWFDYDLDGMHARIVLRGNPLEVESTLLGAHNGENMMVAAGCAVALGLSTAAISAGLRLPRGVPGRLERIEGDSSKAIFVDYAHTPDALARVIAVLRPLCRGRLLVAFGCGGNRDREKRPLMGREVGRGADVALITSDNPRDENPQAIIEAIVEGVQAEGLPMLSNLQNARGYVVEEDRRAAIEAAVTALRPDDVLLVAGKGHEDYQLIGERRLHFDDRELIRQLLHGARSA